MSFSFLSPTSYHKKQSSSEKYSESTTESTLSKSDHVIQNDEIAFLISKINKTQELEVSLRFNFFKKY